MFIIYKSAFLDNSNEENGLCFLQKHLQWYGLFLVREKSEQFFLGSGGKEKLFLNNLLNLESESEKLSETDVVDEMHTILCAATETIAITVGLLLSMMGLYPTIQVGVF
jgi:hypothetical protein